MNKTIIICLLLALTCVSAVKIKKPLPQYNPEVLQTPKVLFSGATE
jgi:hypothetical protein